MTAVTFAQVLKAEGRTREIPNLRGMRRMADKAAEGLVEQLRTLPRDEQVKVAEALIEAFLPLLRKGVRKGYPEYQADQARDEGGKWTAGGVARAAGGAALTGTGHVLRAAREALSTITLVPSSKQTVGQAIKDWYGRLDEDFKDASTSGKGREPALVELAARTFMTVFIGAVMWALAHAFLTSAAGAVGAAVGSALRLLLAR